MMRLLCFLLGHRWAKKFVFIDSRISENNALWQSRKYRDCERCGLRDEVKLSKARAHA